MKKIVLSVVFIYLACMITGGITFAQSGEDAEEKAKEIHRRAMSDVIFIDEELKALYYQNVRIIGLLKEIGELLREKLEDIKESLKELEEIKEDLKSIKESKEKAE